MENVRKKVVKHSSLIGNVITFFASLFLTTLVAILARKTRGEIVGALTFAVPLVVMTLMLRDFSYKWTNAKELLTWQYFVGFVFVGGSVYSWFWASQSTELWSMTFRLIITFLVSLAGGAWMRLGYRPSVEDQKVIQQERWERLRKKVRRAKAETALTILGCNLRYRLVGDAIDGDLDFERPLAEHPELGLLTLEELKTVPESDGFRDSLGMDARGYLDHIVETIGKEN